MITLKRENVNTRCNFKFNRFLNKYLLSTKYYFIKKVILMYTYLFDTNITSQMLNARFYILYKLLSILEIRCPK